MKTTELAGKGSRALGRASKGPHALGRAASAALAALCLTCSLCFLAGCGEKDEAENESSGLDTVLGIITSDDPVQTTEDLVKKGVQAELTELVFSQGWLDGILADIPMSELKAYGISSVSQLQSYIANLDYEIGDISFNGNTANIELIVEGRSFTLGVELVNGEWQITDRSKAELLGLMLAG